MGEPQQAVIYSRKKVLPAFLVVVISAIVLYFIMNAIQPYLIENAFIFDFLSMMFGCMEGSFFYKVMWFFADLTEGTFLASIPGSIIMVIMAFVAASLERKKSPHAGTGVDGNGHIFTKVFICAIVTLFLGQVLYGRFFHYGWIPTFAAVLSVQIFVIFFGTTIPKLITSTLVGTVLTFPICLLIMNYFTAPLGLPLFVSVAFGLVITVPLCSAIFHMIPWMMKQDPAQVQDPEAAQSPAPVMSESKFFVHRVFGDIGELVIWGSSLATIGMYVGAIISWILNPLHPCYAAGNFPLVMCAQICTAALAVFIWYPKWKKEGWAFTFASVVFVSAILSTYSNAWQVVIPTIIVGAIPFAPLVDWLLKTVKYKGWMHVIFYIQVCIGIVCTLWSFVVMYLIVPAI